MSREKEIYHAIALLHIPSIGSKITRELLSTFKSFQRIFESSRDELMDAGASFRLAKLIEDFQDWNLVDQEMEKIQRNNVQVTLITEDSFPRRLMLQEGLPVVLFYRGEIDFNPLKSISIVGTRANSRYGKECTKKVVSDLAQYRPTVFSGLAFGIDILAHRFALDENLATVAVVAHGLHTIYPKEHEATVERMMEHGGGVVSSYLYDTPGLPALFAERNKIVATISEALVVIESAIKGGSMITANIANSYDRPIFALPGRSNDPKSAGPNMLICKEKASMARNGDDIAYKLNWINKRKATVIQPNLFVDLSPQENAIIEALKQGEQHIEVLAKETAIPISEMNSNLLNLELKGLVRSQPGSMYSIVY